MLIPRWFGYGAAVATVAAFAVREVMVYGFSQRLWPVRYAWPPVLRTLAAGFAVFLASRLLPITNLWLSLAFQTGLFALFLLAIWFGGVLSPQDRDAVKEALSSTGHRLGRLLHRK